MDLVVIEMPLDLTSLSPRIILFIVTVDIMPLPRNPQICAELEEKRPKRT